MKQKKPAPRMSRPNASPAQERSNSAPGAVPPENLPPRNKAHERLMRIERRKARSRAIALSTFVLVIMLVTVILIIAVMQQAKPQPQLMFIQQGEIAHTLPATGLIIREETVFQAPAAGLLKPLVSEGSRVASGQKLALVIPSDKEEELKALQKCERDIVDLQTELMQSGKGAGAEAIFSESGAALGSIVNLIRSDIVSGNLANLKSYATSMGVVIEQRTSRLMLIDFKDTRLETLVQTQKSLEKALGLAAGTLICTKPGIVSFRLDGLESVLSQKVAEKMSAGELRQHFAQAAAAPAPDNAVQSGQPVLRISASLYQSLAFLLPDTDAALFPTDRLTSVRIPADGMTVENCRVIRSEATDAGTLLLFRTDRKVEWLSDRRTVQAELTLRVTKGLKVPLSALIGFDPKTGAAALMLVDGGFTRLCQVHVIDSDRDYAIIRAADTETFKLAVAAVLVANPQSVEAGEFIGQ